MKTILCGLLITSFMWTHTARAESPEAPRLTPEYLARIAQYLYRWHLDETALLVVDDVPDVEFRYGWLHPDLDEGDRSQFIELFIPQLKYLVVLKQAHYSVPEMDLEIRNDGFRIYRVEHYDQPPATLADLQVAHLNKQALIEHLFSTRNQTVFPDEALLKRMRAALRAEYHDLDGVPVDGPQTIYVAPISEVSNSLWVFWENARRLIRFSSDSDLTTPAYWDTDKLSARMYDLENSVVISHAEAAGSNAFVTRDWAARALFNCIVFGQRQRVLPNPD